MGSESETSSRGPEGGGADLGRVGAYRLLSVIGEGGFGVVYEAEQTEPVRRRVAVKIVKAGMDSAAVVARFEAERQALAVMDHPCIAKVFDGGVTPPEMGARPYFVMELVRGEAVTSFCDRERLGVRARVELFVRVCEAVQHAHNKGVIHRDLKPSNILVSYDAEGRASPKVIDFGVSKALSGRLGGQTAVTAGGGLVGTPVYMSPEQALSSVDIDTRSDVYSLGVVLYELLAGATPFDSGTMRDAALAEVQRVIREVDPERPSERLARMLAGGGEPGVAARVLAARRTDARTLLGVLRRELDWVVMKCLEKNRERRYETATALAVELGRYLSGEAIQARAPSAAYRVRKFCGRHRAGLAVGAAFLGVLGGAYALAVTQQVRLRSAMTDLERRDQDMQRLQSGLLRSRDALRASRLASAADQEEDRALRDAFAGRPMDEVDRRIELAKAAMREGEMARMRLHALRAVELLELEGAPPGARWVDALSGVAISYRQSMRPTAALGWASRALEAAIQTGDAGQIDEMRFNLSLVLRELDRFEEAEALLREVVAYRAASSGAGSEEEVKARGSLALVYNAEGRHDEAIAAATGALEDARRTLAPGRPVVLQLENNLGLCLLDAGRAGEAAEILRGALARTTERFGGQHMATSIVQRHLGRALAAQGEWEEAERLLLEAAITRIERGRGPDGLVIDLLADRAECLVRLGRREEARAALITAQSEANHQMLDLGTDTIEYAKIRDELDRIVALEAELSGDGG